MKLIVLNLQHSDSEGFDSTPLDEFCQTHDVKGWVNHFYISGGQPQLAIILEYQQSISNGPRASLTESRSRQDGVPVYVVFTNLNSVS